MKELFKYLKDCVTMVLSIETLQSKKNKSQFERSDLKFRKEILPIYLERLVKLIEENKNKNIED